MFAETYTLFMVLKTTSIWLLNAFGEFDRALAEFTFHWVTFSQFSYLSLLQEDALWKQQRGNMQD